MNRRLLATTVSLTALTALSAVVLAIPAGAASPSRPAAAHEAVYADPDAEYATATGLYNNNDIDGAISHLNTAISIRKNFADAYDLRGLCWQVKGDYDKAIADFTQAVNIKPKLYHSYLERGHTYILQKKYASATPDFAKVVEIKPNNSLVHEYSGDAYTGQQQWDNAIKEYTDYLQKAPQETGPDQAGIDPAVYYNRSIAYSGKGDFAGAAKDLKQYLTLVKPGDPGYNEAQLALADAYYRGKDYPNVITTLNPYITKNPNDGNAYNLRALANLQQQKYDEAIPDLQKFLSTNPADPKAKEDANKNLLLALSKSKNGSSTALMDQYTKILNGNPKDPDALSGRAALYIKSGNYNGAVQDYTALIGVKPNDAVAYYNRGIAYGLLNQYDKAIDDFSADLKMRPDDAPAYNNRAVAYGKQSKWKEAASDFENYLRRKSDDTDALKNEGIAYYNVYTATSPAPADPKTDQNLSAAQTALTSYNSKKPGDATVTELLGTIAALRGNASEAIQLGEAAFAKNPSPTAAYNVGLAYLNNKQNDKAAEWFGKAYSLKKDDATLQNKAVAEYNMGFAGNAAAYTSAITDATTLINTNPNNTAALLLRADSYFQTKKWTEAGADYSKALASATKPEDKNYAASQMVASYINAKDYAGVVRATSAAITANPNEPTNYLYRGKAYLLQKDSTNAITDLTKYTSLKSDDASAYYTLGLAYQQKDDSANASANFEKAVGIDGTMADAAFEAGRAYQKSGDDNKNSDGAKAAAAYDKAVAMYDKVTASAKATPKQKSDALYNKAVCFEGKAVATQNDDFYKNAIDAWNAYIAASPTDPELPKIKDRVTALKGKVGQ